MDINDKGKEIPLTEFEYYFAVYGDRAVAVNYSDSNDLSMEEMYQVFKARLASEGQS
jgi:hypothetical protein